jgi:hypothetical protein
MMRSSRRRSVCSNFRHRSSNRSLTREDFPPVASYLAAERPAEGRWSGAARRRPSVVVSEVRSRTATARPYRLRGSRGSCGSGSSWLVARQESGASVGVATGASLTLTRRNFEGDSLTTKLLAPLKRELSIRGQPYTLTISPERLHLTQKGRRKGYELAWNDLVTGDAALATALNASLALTSSPEPTRPPKRKSTTTRSRKPSRKSSVTKRARRG